MQRIAVFPILLFATIARAADSLPTTEELQTALFAKDYPAVLSGTSKVLQLKGGPLADGYHRSTLWGLKAEALVQGNQFTPAADAFGSGAHEKDATDDERNLYLASALLMRGSTPKGYRPILLKQNGETPTYDVLDSSKRREAMAALLANDLADISPRIDALAKSLDADPLLKAAKKIAERRPLEIVIEKSSWKYDALEIQIGSNYVANIEKWHDSSMTLLKTLEALAVQPVAEKNDDGTPSTRTHPRGLTQAEMIPAHQRLDKAVSYARDKKTSPPS